MMSKIINTEVIDVVVVQVQKLGANRDFAFSSTMKTIALLGVIIWLKMIG